MAAYLSHCHRKEEEGIPLGQPHTHTAKNGDMGSITEDFLWPGLESPSLGLP